MRLKNDGSHAPAPKALFLAVAFSVGLIHETKRDERIRLKDVGHYSENDPFGRSFRGEINADIDGDAYKGRAFGIRQVNAGSIVRIIHQAKKRNIDVQTGPDIQP
jgi:hypothetical protein